MNAIYTDQDQLKLKKFSTLVKRGVPAKIIIKSSTANNLHFIIKDPDNNPMPKVKYRIEFEDGTQSITGVTDSKGEIHHYVPTNPVYRLFIEEIPGRIKS
jgi:hypothetical protein